MNGEGLLTASSGCQAESVWEGAMALSVGSTFGFVSKADFGEYAKGQSFREFIIQLFPQPEGGFYVSVPALPSAGTQGRTVDEAYAMAEESIRGMLKVADKSDFVSPDEQQLDTHGWIATIRVPMNEDAPELGAAGR